MTDIPMLPTLGTDSLTQTKMLRQTKELDATLSKVENAGGAKQAEQEKAAQMFEGLLVKEMLKSMWSTVPEGGLLTGSREESMYRDMLNDAYAEDISSGQGLGIKRVIMEEFKRK